MRYVPYFPLFLDPELKGLSVFLQALNEDLRVMQDGFLPPANNRQSVYYNDGVWEAHDADSFGWGEIAGISEV